jgi:tRNA dimethylallyltransferase
MASESRLKSAVLIAGPTASGKSALALALARQRGGLIINTDALQVYKELSILSARPDDDEMMMAPHSLYGHVSGKTAYSVAQWLKDAKLALETAGESELVPIFVGGTGLYFKALTEGLAEVPEVSHDVREKWRSFAGDLHHELAMRDAAGAKRLNPNDRQRLTRALEVIEQTGHPLQYWQDKARGKAALAHYEVERYLVDVPRQELYERAEARFDQMVAAGALDEVRPLMKYDPELPMMKAIGVPELLAHLRGECSLEKAVADAKTATRNYIKRQFTWWRSRLDEWPDRVF